MGKQSRSKKTDVVGKGPVTPIQIAYIVDQYLCDNNLSETRAVFRNEASSLISKSPEPPKSLMSLGTILEEYISLKSQKMLLDQETFRLEQEKTRVENLLYGMQDVMNVYNSTSSVPSSIPMVQSAIRQPPPVAGCRVYKSSGVVHFPVTTNAKHTTPVSNLPLTRKRVGSVLPSAPKKSKLLPLTTPSPATCNAPSTDMEAGQCSSSVVRSSLPNNCLPGGAQVPNGSNVVKSLFNQARSSSSPPLPNSSSPVTPPQSTSSPNSKSGTPNGVTPENITPTSCTVITSERLVVSPCKHIAYTVERNCCVSSSSPSSLKPSPTKRSGKRDCVKGRLDFGGSSDEKTVITNEQQPGVNETSTPESEKDEEDIFCLDLPSMFGPNFSFNELLNDLDLDCPCEQPSGASTDSGSGTSQDGNPVTDHVLSEFSSTVTQVVSGNDRQIQGSSDAPSTVTSITKSIRIFSPAKGLVGSPEHQE